MKITIENTASFVDCKLFACEKLWYGLIVPSGGHLSMTNSTIEDAKSAILPKTGAVLELNGHIFNRNKVGISVQSQKVTPRIFSGNTFTCTSALNTGGVSTTGIEVAVYGYLNIDIGAKQINTFREIRQGVTVTSYSSAFLSNCQFIKIQPAAVSSGGTTSGGNGIRVSVGSYMYIRGTGSINFSGCAIGVNASKSSVNVERCGFGGWPAYLYGVYCDNEGVTRNVTINNSYFYFQNAIYIKGGGGTNTVLNNHFELKAFSEPAITIKNSFGVSSLGANILEGDNTPTFKSNKGLITLTNCRNLHTYSNEVKWVGGEIIFLITNCSNNKFTENNVFFQGGVCCYHNIESPHNSFYSNSSQLATWGFHYLGDCDNTNFSCNSMIHNSSNLALVVDYVMGPQYLKGNTWDKYSGASLFNTPDDDLPQKSRFTVRSPSTPCHPIQVKQKGLDKWFVDLGQNCGPEPACSESIAINEPTPFQINITEANLSGDVKNTLQEYENNSYLYRSLVEYPGLMNENTMLANFYKKNNESEFAKLVGVEKALHRSYAFKEDIQKQIELNLNELQKQEKARNELNPSSDTYNADTELLNNVIFNILSQIQELEEHGEADKQNNLIQVLENVKSIETKTEWSKKEKIIYTILLEKIINKVDTFSTKEIDLLRLFALECLKEGGNAVLLARNLLPPCEQYPSEDAHGEESSLCGKGDNTPIFSKVATQNNAILFYPNPVTSILTVRLPNNIDAQLEMYNLLGQLVLQKKITSSTQNIDVTNFENGIYLCKVLDSNQKISVQKITIQKL